MKLTPLLLATPFFLSFSCNRTGLPNTQLGNWVQAAAIGNAGFSDDWQQRDDAEVRLVLRFYQ